MGIPVPVRLLLALVLPLASVDAGAAVYGCLAPDGSKIYSDKPCTAKVERQAPVDSSPVFEIRKQTGKSRPSPAPLRGVVAQPDDTYLARVEATERLLEDVARRGQVCQDAADDREKVALCSQFYKEAEGTFGLWDSMNTLIADSKKKKYAEEASKLLAEAPFRKRMLDLGKLYSQASEYRTYARIYLLERDPNP
ncbi:MAG TPA: DUF4124 domain-containing protein [Candidatus Binatia bacterium]|nr:DUF4124 domain-containing protein [Candidatus Binatia bacterium]